MKPILDACCGSRMFWFDKSDPRAVFCDNRRIEEPLCDRRVLQIEPDVLCDFKALPFPRRKFPPRRLRPAASEASWAEELARQEVWRPANYSDRKSVV